MIDWGLMRASASRQEAGMHRGDYVEAARHSCPCNRVSFRLEDQEVGALAFVWDVLNG